MTTPLATRLGLVIATVMTLSQGACFRMVGNSDEADADGDGDADSDSDADEIDADGHDDAELDGQGEPPLLLKSLSFPFSEARQGQQSVILMVEVESRSEVALQIHTVELSFSRDQGRFAWRSSQPLPAEIEPNTSTTLTVSISVGEETPTGPVEVNATTITSPQGGSPFVVGPADSPAALTIINGSTSMSDDRDRDGLSDEEEVRLGLDPDDPDGDDDGLDDGDEAPGGVPIDSDGDGRPDVVESDSDDGGEPDLLEWHRGADPTWAGDDRDFALLVVDTSTDELDGPDTMIDESEAGAALSLREALHIAANRIGPDRITFSASLLVAGAGVMVDGAPHTTLSVLPEITDDDTFIDGTGVTLYWDIAPFGDVDTTLLLASGDGATIRDVYFDLTPSSTIYGSKATVIRFADTRDSIVAGVHFFNHAHSGNSAGDALAGEGLSNALFYRIGAAETGEELGLSSALDVSGVNIAVLRSEIEVGHTGINISGADAVIDENLITGTKHSIFISGSGCLVSHNQIMHFTDDNGVNVSGENHRIEDNLIHDGFENGIHIDAWSERCAFRRNSITRNGGAAIVVDDGGQEGIEPPSVTAVDMSSVSGVHSGANGTVIDVFSDPEDEAEVYIGTATLGGGTWSLELANPIAVGHNVMASATDSTGNTSELSQAFLAEL